MLYVCGNMLSLVGWWKKKILNYNVALFRRVVFTVKSISHKKKTLTKDTILTNYTISFYILKTSGKQYWTNDARNTVCQTCYHKPHLCPGKNIVSEANIYIGEENGRQRNRIISKRSMKQQQQAKKKSSSRWGKWYTRDTT